jgi:hypothetical protein
VATTAGAGTNANPGSTIESGDPLRDITVDVGNTGILFTTTDPPTGLF